MSTGVPRGCVAPSLFSIYTNKIKCDISGMSLLKYADDMALVAYMRDEHPWLHIGDLLILWFLVSRKFTGVKI